MTTNCRKLAEIYKGLIDKTGIYKSGYSEKTKRVEMVDLMRSIKELFGSIEEEILKSGLSISVDGGFIKVKSIPGEDFYYISSCSADGETWTEASRESLSFVVLDDEVNRPVFDSWSYRWKDVLIDYDFEYIETPSMKRLKEALTHIAIRFKKK